MISREDMLALAKANDSKRTSITELREVIWMKKDLVKEHFNMFQNLSPAEGRRILALAKQFLFLKPIKI